MPVQDWTRVIAGTFHHFHGAWITHLAETMNDGFLPKGYYALSEQHAGKVITDILTLDARDSSPVLPREEGGVAVAAPPKVSRKMVASPSAAYRASRRTLAIRHTSGHRLVALVEVLSPANKDRPSSIQDFVDKVHAALRQGCHLLVVDLFPPGPSDPHTIHGAIWECFDPEDYEWPEDKPLTLAAYVATKLPEAYLEHRAVGALPDMPLFLTPDFHIETPLQATYDMAYRGVAAYWRQVVEGGA